MDPRRFRRTFSRDQGGVAVVIGAILIVGVLVIAAITAQTKYVPIWDKRREYEHALLVESQIAALRAELDRQVVNPSSLTVSNPLSMAGSTSSGLGMAKPGDKISFTPGTQTIQVAAPRLSIQTTGAGIIGGVFETWTGVTSTGVAVTDIGQAVNLRLRMHSVSGDNDSQTLTMTATDANGFAGDFQVTIDNPSGNDFRVLARVRNSASTVIFDQPIDTLPNNAEVSPYWVDCLEARFHFDQILAAATGPISLSLAKGSAAGLGGDFAITYVQQSGGVVVGGVGQVVQQYSQTLSSGTLTYTANNVRWPAQTYVMESGGMLVKQNDGAAFRIAPALTATSFSATSSSLVLVNPGAVQNDVMLAQITAVGGTGQSITPPGGWALVPSGSARINSANALAQAIYYKVAGASEPGTYTFTFSQNFKGSGGIVAYSGINTASPFDGIGGQANAASTAATAPSVSTTVTNNMLVNFFGAATLTSVTPPPATTERFDLGPSGSSSVTTEAVDAVVPGTGATGTRVATLGISATNIGHTIALKKATTAAFRGASSGTTDVPAGTSISLSIPTLVGNQAEFTGDQAITVQTRAQRGLDLQAIGPFLWLNITTSTPKVWGTFLRSQLAVVPGFVEGTQFTVDDTGANIVRITIRGVSALNAVDDLQLAIREARVTVTIRG